ncbi:MAG TPA: glycosyltransferase [Isosphaeraceae bacterium]|nr:glycosyltransferase [Isosphaeraceae bacterium]
MVRAWAAEGGHEMTDVCRCVYIDARPLWCRRFTGIARYTARLALELAAHVQVRFFFDGDEAVARPGLNGSHEQDLARWARRIVRSPRRPLETPPAGSVGIYPAARPLARRFPFEVSVLHDFSPLLLPATHTEATRREYEQFFAQTVLSSDLVLADSHSTKADSAWLTALPQERVVVAHCGPSLCVHGHAHKPPAVRSKHIGLVVSTLEPRKNPEFLLDWFARTNVLPHRSELWWAGPMGWLTSRNQKRRMGGLPGARKVRFLGAVSDSSLCRLYQQAAWSIYPSLYEGFGFPVLDSLRHGTPVLAGGHSAVREFSSPGLAFFDPCDPASVDAAWVKLFAAGVPEIPAAPLDERYSWRRVVRLIMERHAQWRMQGRLHAEMAA